MRPWFTWRGISLTNVFLCFWIIFQLAIKGIYKNMSLPNTKDTGDTLSVVVKFSLLDSIVVASDLSIRSSAFATVLGELVYSRTQSIFPTVLCILSQIALSWGFRLVLGTSLIEALISKSLNYQPVKSPPLSRMYLFGKVYLANKDCSHLDLIFAEVFLSTLMISTILVTKSIHGIKTM